jgi:O-antigen ligase
MLGQPISAKPVHHLEDRPTAVEWAATGLLAAACVAAPLALGATAAWPRFATEAAMGLAAAVWSVTAIRTPRSALLPLAVAALLAVQLLPLPDQLLGMISPVSAAAWKLASVDATGSWGRITVDPATTAAGIRRLLLAAATLAAVADLGRRAPLRRLLCSSLCVVCIAIWVLGLAFPFERQKLVMLGFIDCKGPIAAEFWKTPIEPPIGTNGSGNLEWVAVGQQRYQSATWIAADGFGPYLYSNHFAGAMCLTLPVLLGGWLFWSRRRLPNAVRHLVVAAVFAAGLWTVGVMATSRAGSAAMLLAALVFASLTSERLWMRRTACALTLLYALLVVSLTVAIYAGWSGIEQLFPAALQPRIASLLTDSRAMAARAALRMFAAAPLLGSGLGTFGELFTKFLRSDFLLNYAHNDYAQWLAETGLLGGGVAAGFVAALVSRFRGWWQGVIERRQGVPVTAGLWAAIAGIGIHTAYDWNLHIPANALLACVVAGLALAAGNRAPLVPQTQWLERSQMSRWPGYALAGACLLAVAFLARDAASDAVQRDVRKAIVAARIAAIDKTAPPAAPLLRAANATAERSIRWDPANAHLAVLIGLTRLHLAATPDARADSVAQLATANDWFARARRACAACRGLPETLSSAVPAGTR